MGVMLKSSLMFFDPTLQIISSTGSYYTHFESVGRELNALAERVDSLVVCGQTLEKQSTTTAYKLSESISVVDLPYWSASGDKTGFLKGLLRNAPRTFKAIRKSDADVILLRSGPHPASIVAWFACRNLDVTTIYFIGSDFKQNAYLRTEKSHILRKVSERGYAHLTDTLTHYIARTVDATFVHPGHLESKYSSANRLYTTIISTIFADEVSEVVDHKPGKSISILYVGGLSRPKGVDVLVRSFADVMSATDADVTLTIRGTGGDEEELRRLTVSMGVADDIEFVPYLPYDELLELYRDADIFVLPSRQEGQGRVLVEAMAMGCAVLSSDVGGIPHIVTDRKNGLLVPPDDEDALTQGLTTLIENPNLRLELARGGIAWAEKHTLEIQTEEFLEKIRSIHEK